MKQIYQYQKNGSGSEWHLSRLWRNPVPCNNDIVEYSVVGWKTMCDLVCGCTCCRLQQGTGQTGASVPTPGEVREVRGNSSHRQRQIPVSSSPPPEIFEDGVFVERFCIPMAVCDIMVAVSIDASWSAYRIGNWIGNNRFNFPLGLIKYIVIVKAFIASFFQLHH